MYSFNLFLGSTWLSFRKVNQLEFANVKSVFLCKVKYVDKQHNERDKTEVEFVVLIIIRNVIAFLNSGLDLFVIIMVFIQLF